MRLIFAATPGRMAGRIREQRKMTETTRYHRFDDLRPDQQQQARDRFSKYRLEAYRYELDRRGHVLCRRPEADFRDRMH